MTPSARALSAALIIAMECGGDLDRYLHAYPDGGGVWTIAGGSTFMPNGRRVQRGDAVTHAEALALLERQIDAWAAVVAQDVTVPLSDNWTAVLVSFVHQMGSASLRGSVLADMLNAGLFERAAAQLNGWVIAMVEGVRQPVLGIMRRMEAQRRIALGAPVEPTRTQVWALGDAVLRPLYTAACKDALAYRHGVATWEPPASVTRPVAQASQQQSAADALMSAELDTLKQGT